MPEAKPPLFPDNPHFWFETLRVIAADEYGGSQFGEVLAVADRIKGGDYDSWFEAWNAIADRVAGEADDRLRPWSQGQRARRISARFQLLSVVGVLPSRDAARSSRRPRLSTIRGLLQGLRCAVRSADRAGRDPL